MYNIDNLIMKINENGGQNLIAKSLGLPQNSLSDLTNKDKALPKIIEKMCLLANYFNCTIDYLLGREEKQNQQSEEEEKLLTLFNKLNEEKKSRTMSYVINLLNAQEKGYYTQEEFDDMTNPLKKQHTYIAAMGGGVQKFENNENIEELIKETFGDLDDEFEPILDDSFDDIDF